MTYLKVLRPDGRVYHHSGDFRWPLPVKADDGTWTPGDWVTVKRPLKRGLRPDDLCTARVLHGLRPDQLPQWLGPAIFEMEFDGPVVEGADKVGGKRARLTRRLEAWDDRAARLFACDVAEDALRYAEPSSREALECVIYVARCYADGEATRDQLEAAREAAWDAAGAAGGAAGAAAWAAAGAAAWAAGGAAGAAAWEEYTRWLLKRIGVSA